MQQTQFSGCPAQTPLPIGCREAERLLFAFVVLWWYKARMDIKEFTEGVKAVGGADAVEKFAISCGTTGQYLSQIVRGHKTAGPEVCAQVHIMSGYRVSLHSMRPDIYPKESMTHDPLQK